MSVLGRQFHQLSMVHQSQYGEERAQAYVPVREIAENWEHSEGPMSRKLSESREPSFDSRTNARTGPSLHHEIARDGGVHSPVLAAALWHDADTPKDAHALVDGHHRVAALYDQHPDALIPVVWQGGHDPNGKSP